jgi:hemin uptake protein HemP
VLLRLCHRKEQKMSFHSVPRVQPNTTLNLPTYDANLLTQDGDLAHIVLNDQTYTLRITRAGKLILTK